MLRWYWRRPMLRKAPPLESVEIFVAAARGGSFRGVARDLALSPSVVSRRISGLEDFLGVRLFNRAGLLPSLTAAGVRYLERVEPGLRAIADAGDDMGAVGGGRLRVATSHSFASHWLVPRLPALLEKTGIDVELVLGPGFEALVSRNAQIGIWGGRTAPTGLGATRLFEVNAIPVAAARVAEKWSASVTVNELAGYPLVAVTRPGNMWDRWLGAVPRNVRSYDTLNVMYEAAAAGLGTALAIPLLSEPFLSSDRLRVCQPQAKPLGLSYDLYRRTGTTSRGAERIFTDWLHAEVGASLVVFSHYATSQNLHP